MRSGWIVVSFSLGLLFSLAVCAAIADEGAVVDVAEFSAEPTNPGGLGSPVSVYNEALDAAVEYDQAGASAPSAAAAPPPPKCDAKKQAALAKAVATAHKGVFYNNKFDYVLDPCYDGWQLGDRLKRISLGDWGMLDLGGQYRTRLHNEKNIRSFGLTGKSDDFLLQRTRLYSNLEIGDNFRTFAEFYDASSNFQEFAPRNIEVNRNDFLNLFADARLLDRESGALWARVGRQEMLFGSQRVISPLDWANTRRRFDGVDLFWRGKDWDIDAFMTNPVVVNPDHFDAPDRTREFSGSFARYKGVQNQTLDLYALRYVKTSAPGNFNLTTLGGNWQGSKDEWLWDIEGAYQFGDFTTAPHQSGFWVAGVGKKFEQYDWKPVFWAYYDWAAGGTPVGNAYDQLFPFNHYYNGFMDIFGRRNLQDANFQLTLKPTEKLTVLAWHHIFWLEKTSDVPYTVIGTPFVATPGGNNYLGQELDLLATWQFKPRQSLQFGFSYFWHGKYFDTNPAVPFRGNADFCYTTYTINF